MTDNERSHVKAVDTAVSILEVIQDRNDAGVTEIARALDVSKANVYKHLVTLHSHDFLIRSGDEYRLGYRFFEFGSVVRNDEILFQEAVANLRKISTITGEIATLMVQDGDMGVYIYSIDPANKGRPGAREGTRTLLSETASGRAILRRRGGDDKNSPSEQGQNELPDSVGQNGESWIAQTDDETGLREIAAPVIRDDGEPVGAVALFIDAPEVSEQVEPNYTKLVKKTALTVSKRMGIRDGHQARR